jgi:dUTP pyrophosphatase
MLLNAIEVESYLTTNDMGQKAQVGYDLTLKGVKRIYGGTVTKDKTELQPYSAIEPDASGIYRLQPGTYSLTFDQGVKLDNKTTAFIRHRSSVLRCGGIITSGVYDPAFCVEEMGAVLVATQPIDIELGARVAQVIIFENHEAEAYNGQWNREKDVK